MNKYSLGTIVGAALLGLSKKWGSKSEAVSAKLERVYAIEVGWVMITPGHVNRFPPSMIDDEILSELLSFVVEYPGIYESLDKLYIKEVLSIESEEKSVGYIERQEYPVFHGDEDSEEREAIWDQFEDENPQDIGFLYETVITFTVLPYKSWQIDMDNEEYSSFADDIKRLLSRAVKYPFYFDAFDSGPDLREGKPIIVIFDQDGNEITSPLPQESTMKLRER
jgi:hypothetical protein